MCASTQILHLGVPQSPAKSLAWLPQQVGVNYDKLRADSYILTINNIVVKESNSTVTAPPCLTGNSIFSHLVIWNSHPYELKESSTYSSALATKNENLLKPRLYIWMYIDLNI